MDGTLLRWTLNGERWPNKLTDYALWSGKVAAMLQGMHADGFKIAALEIYLDQSVLLAKNLTIFF